jgi:hypothetical protein
MAISIYKTFTRAKLTYQDLNGLQAYFRDYINTYLQLSTDCVSANTANKVVKRDASGNFAAGTITANLTGDVTGDLKTGSTINGHAITDIFESDGVTAKAATLAAACSGNAATATLANATIGDTRFQVSGCIGGGIAGGTGTVITSISGSYMVKVHGVYISVPAGKYLKLKRLRYSLTVGELRLRIDGKHYSYTTSASHDDIVLDETLTNGPYNWWLDISVVNPGATARSVYSTDSWWLDLAIE